MSSSPPPYHPASTPAPASVIAAIHSADAFAFDVDSTCVTEEGIDVLAAFLGRAKEVSSITASAMGGSMLFQDALTARLTMMQPTYADILACITQHPFTLTPHLTSLFQLIRQSGKRLVLVTGGFRQMLVPLVKQLGVEEHHLYANQLLFTEDGRYAGYDTTQPTSVSGGKAKALSLFLQQEKIEKVVMIGDGVTDLEARPPACCFIGYGGVVVREKVKKEADWFIYDWRELADILQ